jgi:DNA-3-methyladenine glycosylase
MNKILPQDFYFNDTVWVAKNLIGKTLVRTYRGQTISGTIVETEAYLGSDDPACHSYGNRKSKRNQSMFLSGGHAYVYFIYGMYFCFNVVTKDEKNPEAVLIRGVAPIANGPGKLCRELKIDKKLDGILLNRGPIFITESSEKTKMKLGTSARIGIGHKNAARDWALRFYALENPYVSKMTLQSIKCP